MTNPTPHGQVPEALRLAEQYDHGDPAAHGNAWKAAVCTELRRLAELEAQIEALSGVQALSAAPEGWKAVPVNPTPEMWKAAKSVPDPNPPYPPHYGLVWDAMLAASPTPPAEQQAAPKAAPGDPSAFPMTGDEEESDLGQWQPGTAKPNMDGTYLREFDEGEATSEFHQGVWLRDGFFPSELQDVRWRGRAAPQQEAQEPTTVDQKTMEIAESVGLIGPASRAGDLHAAIQRFHDLICVNATIKAAVMAADAIRGVATPAPDCHHRPPCDECAALAAQGGSK